MIEEKYTRYNAHIVRETNIKSMRPSGEYKQQINWVAFSLAVSFVGLTRTAFFIEPLFWPLSTHCLHGFFAMVQPCVNAMTLINSDDPWSYRSVSILRPWVIWWGMHSGIGHGNNVGVESIRSSENGGTETPANVFSFWLMRDDNSAEGPEFMHSVSICWLHVICIWFSDLVFSQTLALARMRWRNFVLLFF